MINVTEIMKRGAENKKLPPWVNMRHAWMVNDGLRDKIGRASCRERV